MEIKEHVIKVYLLKNIKSKIVLEKIAELVDQTLSKDEEFLQLHKENRFKFYCFDGLFPLAENGVYKEGGIYSFRLRSVDNELSEFLKKNIALAATKYIKVLTVQVKTIPKRPIEKLYSITPVVLKHHAGYWQGHLTITDFERRLKENLIKKQNIFYQNKLDEDFQFHNQIEFNNVKPIASVFKDITILGDKVTLYISENETAQALAYFALGAGLLEMSSRGYGFCGYRFL